MRRICAALLSGGHIVLDSCSPWHNGGILQMHRPVINHPNFVGALNRLRGRSLR
jgi:hypothetical protein